MEFYQFTHILNGKNKSPAFRITREFLYMKAFSMALLTVALLVNCKQKTSSHKRPIDSMNNSRTTDSVTIVNLLKDVYQWHNQHGIKFPDFDVNANDSFQTGLNYDSFNKTFTAIKQTGYFSSGFIDNYREIADSVNNRLATANPKLLNEINFSFQDADPWTGFQDDFPNYWNYFTITDYRLVGGSVSLKWKVKTNDWSTEGYAVTFSKENGRWKVAYLEGFDITKIL